jgi:hypothetical protein
MALNLPCSNCWMCWRPADADGVVRRALEAVLHALIEAEASAVICAESHQGTRSGSASATATVTGRCQLLKVEAMLRDAPGEIAAFADFPAERWRKIWSTNGLECAKKAPTAAPTWSACSPTRRPCSASPARCSPRYTTNGRSETTGFSPRRPWQNSTGPCQGNRQPIRRRWLPSPLRSRHSASGEPTTAKAHTAATTPLGGT